MKSKVLIILIIISVAAATVYFIASKKPVINNVILISMDTTRADYLSCYGYRRRTTPFIDSIAAEGVLFENAFSHVPLTLPSHSSMLTGTIPPYHGVHDNIDYRLGDSNVTLAEILKANSFKTAAVVSSFVIDSEFGLDQGFDYYNDEFIVNKSEFSYAERGGQEATYFANKWLEANGQDKFFMFVHYYDPHAQYQAPEPFGSMFSSQFDFGMDKFKNAYAGEIAYTDHCIKQLIDKLKELDLYDSTLIIITSDHGEMFGEHDELFHGFYVYRSAIRVPLIFKLPGRNKAIRINDICGLSDIVPTICNLLDIETPKAVQGKSLTNYFKVGKSGDHERNIFSESLVPTTFSANSLLSVINNKWQYIQTTRPELYDITADPLQINDLIEKEPQRARLLQNILREILEASVKTDTSDSKYYIDDDARKKLESLGYIQGRSVDESFDFDQSKPDPKDYIGFYNKKVTAAGKLLEGYHDEAKKLCLEMIAEHPDNPYSYLLLGNAEYKTGQLDKAAANYLKLQELDPENSTGYHKLAIVFSEQKKLKEALEQLQKAIEIEPDNIVFIKSIGVTLARLKDYKNAVKYFSMAIEFEKDDAGLNRMLGQVYFHLNDFDNSIKYFTISLKLEPNDTNARGWLSDAKAMKARRDKTK